MGAIKRDNNVKLNTHSKTEGVNLRHHALKDMGAAKQNPAMSVAQASLEIAQAFKVQIEF